MKKQSKYDDGSKDKDRRIALFGTIGFYTVLVLVFLILGFKTPLPYPEEEGAYVMLGNVDFGSENQLSAPETITEPSQQETKVEETSPVEATEEVITQDIEEAPVIEEKKKENTEKVEKEIKKPEAKTETTETTKTEEKQPERQSNPLFEFNKNKTGDPGKGSGDKSGVQGNPNGDPNANTPGKGSGAGFSFNLSGRGLVKAPPQISGENQNPEKVVIEITVNQAGKVVNAKPTIKGGATLTTGPLVQKALKAALQMEFSAKKDAFEEQTGSVTFNFKPYK